MKKSVFILIYSFILILSIGCGGGGEITKLSVSGNKVGVLLDSKVIGAYYETSSGIRGKTNQNGEYYYEDGDTIEFFVGNVKIGQAKGSQLTTVFDFDSPDKVAVLLQSLDLDGNPNNGIDISDEDFKKMRNSTFTLQEVDPDSSSFRKKFKTVMGYDIEIDSINAQEHALDTLKKELIQKIDLDFFQMILNKKLPEKGLVNNFNNPYFDSINYDSNDYLNSYESRIRAYFYTKLIKTFLINDIEALAEVQKMGQLSQETINKNSEALISTITGGVAIVGIGATAHKDISQLLLFKNGLATGSLKNLVATSVGQNIILKSAYNPFLSFVGLGDDTFEGRILRDCTPIGGKSFAGGIQCIARLTGEIGTNISQLYRNYSDTQLERKKQAKFMAYQYLGLYYSYDKREKVLLNIFKSLAKGIDSEYSYSSFNQNNDLHFEEALDILAKVSAQHGLAHYTYSFDEAKKTILEYQTMVEDLINSYIDTFSFEKLNVLDQDYMRLNLRLEPSQERNKVKVCLDITNQSSFTLKSPDGRVKYFLDNQEIGSDSFVLDNLTTDIPYIEKCTTDINISPEQVLISKILRVEYDLNYLPMRMDTSFKKQKGVKYYEISKENLTSLLQKPVIKLSAPITAYSGDEIYLDAIESYNPNGDALDYKWEYIPRLKQDDSLRPYIQNSTSFRANFKAPILPDDKMRYKLRFKLTVTATNGQKSEKFFYVVILQPNHTTTITGQITTEDGKALSGVSVKFFYTENGTKKSVSDKSDTTGKYSFKVTDMQFKKGFDIVYASTNDNSYKPVSKEINKIKNVTSYRVDFVLSPMKNDSVIIDEDTNRIHHIVTHLGDNDFGGGVNAQLPKDATDTELTLSFNISQDQYDNYQKAEITYLAQGVERYGDKLILNNTAHQMKYNTNAQYKNFTISISKDEYHVGINTLTIISAKNSSGDYDDFRFTNLQITFLDPVTDDTDTTLEDLLNNIFNDTDYTTQNTKPFVWDLEFDTSSSKELSIKTHYKSDGGSAIDVVYGKVTSPSGKIYENKFNTVKNFYNGNITLTIAYATNDVFDTDGIYTVEAYVINEDGTYSYTYTETIYLDVPDSALKSVTVTNFWQSNSSGIYKASCKQYEKIIDGQFTIKNSGNSKIYIEKLALAVHHANGEYFFDIGIVDIYKWLLKGDSITIPKQGAWLTDLGNYQMVAKAYYDDSWHNLSIKNFTIIENPECNNNNDGYFPSSPQDDYDLDQDYDGDDDGYETNNFYSPDN